MVATCKGMTMKNIKKLNQGKYEIRFSYVEDLTGKRRRIRRRIEGTLKEAEKLRDRLKVKAHDGDLKRHDRRPDKRLSEWIDDYLAYREKSVASSTFKNERYQYQGPVIDAVGDWRPQAIKLHHLDSLVRTWETADISYSTARNRRGLTIRFLRWVFKRVSKNPAFLRDVERVSTRNKTTKKGRALTPSEAKAFLTAMKNDYPQHHALVFTLLITGQRWGSVTALRWDDIDHEKGLITFSQSHYRGDVKKGNKSGKVVRIPMPDALATVLKDHRRMMLESQHVNLSTGLCFPTETPAGNSASNGYQNAGDLRGPFKQCCEQAGIKKATPHDLRRTFNSWTIDAGIDGTIIRSITGHSDEAMTDHYYRGNQQAKAEAMGSVLNLVEGA